MSGSPCTSLKSAGEIKPDGSATIRPQRDRLDQSSQQPIEAVFVEDRDPQLLGLGQL